MSYRRWLIAASFTLCLIAFACWILSGYEPISSAKNVPAVSILFDGGHAMQYLDSLTRQFKGRVVGSAQGFAAADYVARQFRMHGLKVEMQDFREAGSAADLSNRNWYSGRNVIGILPGQEQGAVVLTAHRDCVGSALEGAYDNGSGTAIVMELARVLASGKPHRYTYAFVALDGEEAGFAGARALLNRPPDALKDIRLMVNFDMVGFKQKSSLAVTHAQYLSPETRSLVSSFFSIPSYSLFEFPMGRGTDAQLYALRGLPALDVREILPRLTRIEYHSIKDTVDQISAESMQRAGRTIEQLILQGDLIGAFTPTPGLAVSDDTGVLPHWRYSLGGFCLFAVFAAPFLLRFRGRFQITTPATTLAVLGILTGALTVIGTRWTGSAAFALVPLLGTLAFLILQIVLTRRARGFDQRLTSVFVSAAPALLFGGTWILTGMWTLGFWPAILSYAPAVLFTGRTGRYWRLLDVALILPTLLLTWLIALIAWLTAPTHAFPPVKLAVFASIYIAVALIGTWGIFGRRRAECITAQTSPAEPPVSQIEPQEATLNPRSTWPTL